MLPIALATLLASDATAAPKRCAFRIVGVWRLVSASSQTADGKLNDAPYGPSPSGLLIYTVDGHMSVMISEAERPHLSTEDRVAAPVAERASAFASFFGYSGRYSFSCNRIVHHVDIASVPNWVGLDMARLVSVRAGRLVLSTPPRKVGGTTSTFELVWERSN